MSRRLKQVDLSLQDWESRWVNRLVTRIQNDERYADEIERNAKTFKDFFKGALVVEGANTGAQYIVVEVVDVTMRESQIKGHLYFYKKIGLSGLGRLKWLRRGDTLKISGRQFEDLFLKGEEDFDYRKDIRQANTRIQRLKRLNKPYLLKPKFDQDLRKWMEPFDNQEVELFLAKPQTETVHSFKVKILLSSPNYWQPTNFTLVNLSPDSEERVHCSRIQGSKLNSECDHSGHRNGWTEDLERQMGATNRFLYFLRRYDVYTQMPTLK